MQDAEQLNNTDTAPVPESEPDKKRKNAPGQGRKPNKETMYKRAIDLYQENFEEIVREMIAKALAQEIVVECPECGHKWKLKVAGTGDKDLLIHIDNRILGRAAQTIDHRISATLKVSPEDYEDASRKVIEGEFRLLNGPELLESGIEEAEEVPE